MCINDENIYFEFLGFFVNGIICGIDEDIFVILVSNFVVNIKFNVR